MIISHVHRYVFIEVPQTASTALANELIENYDGQRIHLKHSDYAEFHRSASQGERSYRVLATVRNPLDIVVSKFVKARDDHKSLYASHCKSGAPWGFRFRPEARERAFIARRGPDFDGFVRHFYRRTYNNRACLLPSSAHVMRYESLNDDFAAWLKAAGIAMVRAIPPRNRTAGRVRDFTEWYTGDLRRHAATVFGPYMRKWGYALPDEWPEVELNSLTETWFLLDNVVRRFYLKHIHYGWVMPRSKSISEAGAETD